MKDRTNCLLSPNHGSRLSLLVAWSLIGLLVGSSTGAAESDFNRARHDLEAVAAAYFDLGAQLPSTYTCELRSPEVLASLDANARKAWGNGHMRLTKNAQGSRIVAENLAQPKMKPFFDLGLGIWQLRLGTALGVIQAYAPSTLAALALGIAASPLTHEVEIIEHGTETITTWTARGENHELQSVELVTVDEEIRKLSAQRRNGSGFEAFLESRRSPLTNNLLTVSSAAIHTIDAKGAVETLELDLGYVAVEGSDAVMLGHIAIRRLDGSENLIRRNAKDVNPISFTLSRCTDQVPE